TQKSFAKRCLRYSDPSFSIFKKSMTDDERHLLSEALSMLGQFDGLPNLDSLENLRLSLGVGESSRVISFTKNPLENSNLLGALFTAITNRQVIEIEYCAFTIASESNKIVIHPYLLKEYNRRWYLFAAADNDDKLLSFSLDRINEVVALPSRTYIESTQDLNDHFDDIIGVTLLSDNPIEKILFWVSDISKHYVATKPLHDSQKHYQSIKEQSYREQYPMLNGGYFFSIECRKNYELIRELSSFGKELLVLSPQSIQDEVLKRLNNTLSEYEKLRT
ncbi:MAG: WYL domain-containing protein, partial [Rikenellaceae bacterium]